MVSMEHFKKIIFRGDSFCKAFSELGQIRSLIPSLVRDIALTATDTVSTRNAAC